MKPNFILKINQSYLFLVGILLCYIGIGCEYRSSNKNELGNLIDYIGECPYDEFDEKTFSYYASKFKNFEVRIPYVDQGDKLFAKKLKTGEYLFNIIKSPAKANDTNFYYQILFMCLGCDSTSVLSSAAIREKLGPPAGKLCRGDSLWRINNGFLVFNHKDEVVWYYPDTSLTLYETYFDKPQLPNKGVLQTMIKSDSQYIQLSTKKLKLRSEQDLLSALGMNVYYVAGVSANDDTIAPIKFELTYSSLDTTNRIRINSDTIKSNFGSLFSKLNLDIYYSDIERALNHMTIAEPGDARFSKNEPDEKIIHMIRGNNIIQVRNLTFQRFNSYQITFYPRCAFDHKMEFIVNF